MNVTPRTYSGIGCSLQLVLAAAGVASFVFSFLCIHSGCFAQAAGWAVGFIICLAALIGDAKKRK